MPLSLQERFQRLFDVPLQEGYAMTESVVIAWNRVNGIRPGSLGTPAGGVEVRVVDLEGRPVADGHVGELEVRSAANFSGYWAGRSGDGGGTDRWLAADRRPGAAR